MKNILILVLITSFFQALKAQDGNIIAFSEYKNDSIKLSWSIDNVKSFEDFKQYGVTIKRQIFEQNHQLLSYSQRLASETTIVSNLKPKSRTWMLNNLTHPKAPALMKLFYDTLDSEINLDNPKLIDAVNKEKIDRMKHFMTVFVAGQDFSLASAAGLGFIDISNVLPNHAYRYILTITDSLGKNLVYPLYINVETYQNVVYTLPEIKTERGINTLTLRWTPEETQQYTSYDIFRSLAGQNTFTKINEEPFVFMKMSGTDSKDIVYTDSIPGGIYYDYKIKGRTPVGSVSPFSAIVTDKALIQPVFNFPLTNIDPVQGDSTILVKWKMPDSLNTYITHFNIYRSKDQDDNYEKINVSGISSTLREYLDYDAIPEGFYIVEAIASDSNFYRTIPVYAQLVDSIPPAPPVGLTAQYFGKSKVVVSWSANTEEDIYGYRVMIGDTRNGNYNQITSDAVTTIEYTTTTDPGDPRDSTYFKVFAVDKRGNYSELSEAFGLKKPNSVPPAKPSLTVVKPSKGGIKLTWKYSSSTDVVKHVVQRKMEGTPTWVDVVTISNEDKVLYTPTDSTDYCYIDSTLLEQRPYEYRVNAVNDQYTNASSDIMSVTPMAPVFTSTNISNFAIEEESIPSGINPSVELEINNLKRANHEQGSRFSSAGGSIVNIIVKWTYPLDPTVQDFQVYRSITGGATTLFRTISIEEAMGMDPNTEEITITEDMGPTNLSIKDKDLLKGRRYTYQVLARHIDQSTTKLSNSLTLKIAK